MKRYFASFYGKLSAIFLLLLLAAGLVHVWVTLDSYREFERESNQGLNRDLAAHLAERFQPFLADSDYASIEHTFHELMVMNPFVEIYLIDESGVLLAYFADPAKIKRSRVDLAPVLAYVDGGSEVPFPLYGDDPRSLDQRKPFSAVRVTIGTDRPGFLYVILGGEQYDSAAAMIRKSYIIRTTAVGAAVIFLGTVAIGLLSFFLLTRRLRHVTAVVQRFREGDWHQRVDAPSADEIGQLGEAFNQMADTIVANVGQLEQTDRLRRELVAGISHDLRSPLTSIQGYIETILLKEPTLSAHERRRYLETVTQNVVFLSRLVDDLFELSKLEARQTLPQLEPFSIEELAHDVVLKYQPQAEARQLRLVAPDPQELPLVSADVSMIERTLDNLIENALRYTPPEGEIRIDLSRQQDRVNVAVSDSGSGIPAEDLPYIFDRFYRVDRSLSGHPDSEGGTGAGTGLGLAISSKIVEAHHSQIDVRSGVDEGTTFSFALGISADTLKGPRQLPPAVPRSARDDRPI